MTSSASNKQRENSEQRSALCPSDHQHLFSISVLFSICPLAIAHMCQQRVICGVQFSAHPPAAAAAACTRSDCHFDRLSIVCVDMVADCVVGSGIGAIACRPTQSPPPLFPNLQHAQQQRLRQWRIINDRSNDQEMWPLTGLALLSKAKHKTHFRVCACSVLFCFAWPLQLPA